MLENVKKIDKVNL